MTAPHWATDPDRLRAALGLYLVADPEQSASDNLVADTAAAIAGGVTCVQLRAKHLSDFDVLDLAIPLADLCRQRDVPFLVNDRLDVALAVNADGLHVGLNDLPIAVVRRLGGDRFVIGWSPETEEQAASTFAEDADYVGLGPVFPTGSKLDAGAAIGLDGLTQRVRVAGVPTVGIGGISAISAASVIAAGTDGVAVISAILRSPDPRAAARQLRTVVDDALRSRTA